MDIKKIKKPVVQLSGLYDTVFENAAVVLALVDEDRKVLNINKTGEDALGKQKAAILNKLAGEVFDCTNAWSRGKVVCGMGKHCKKCVLRSSIANTFESGETNYKKEGHLDVELDGKVVRLQLLITTANVTIDGKKCVLLTIDDITQLKEKEEKLEEAIATKDKFFSIISHDLRGPLGAVLNLSEIVNTEISKENLDTYKGYMGVMHSELENTFKLLEDLLYWSRAQKGDIRMNPELLQLKKVAQEMITVVSGLGNKKYIQLINAIPEEITIMGDKNMISTLFRNLISNAIKFTNEEGRVEIIANIKKGFVEVQVKDNGIGISEEAQKYLFDVSVNSSTSGTANEKGTGLGLILCKEFVEQHGGKIWVESEKGDGTSVFFTLPN